jgi:hypothetical protein
MKAAAMLLLCLWSAAARAQLPQPDPGDLWVSFDEIGNKLCTVATPFVTDNHFWVVTWDIQNDLAGFEFQLTADPSVVVFSAGVPLDPGGDCSLNGTFPFEWICGLGRCLDGAGLIPLVQFTYGVFDTAADARLICQGPSTPSSFDPPVPGYLTCLWDFVPFTPHPSGGVAMPDGCGMLYAGSAPPTFEVETCSFEGLLTEAESWGSVKSMF